MRKVLTLVSLIVLIAGCGNTITGHFISNSKPTHCTVYGYGNDVRVSFSSVGAPSLCSEFIRQWSEGSGIYWDSTYTFPQEPPLQTVCSLRQNGSLMVVTDDGGQYYGERVCAAFAAGGWTQS
jgi:hypothetical protein